MIRNVLHVVSLRRVNESRAKSHGSKNPDEKLRKENFLVHMADMEEKPVCKATHTACTQ